MNYISKPNILTSRVELHKLHILTRQTSTSNHSTAITSRSMGRSAGEVSTAITTSSQHSVLGAESDQNRLFNINKGKFSDGPTM